MTQGGQGDTPIGNENDPASLKEMGRNQHNNYIEHRNGTFDRGSRVDDEDSARNCNRRNGKKGGGY
jgi:hypothetical protein